VNGWPQKGQIILSCREPLASLRDSGRCGEKITVTLSCGEKITLTIKGIIAMAKRLDCAAAAFYFAPACRCLGSAFGPSGSKCDKSATI
jgi:hypothetical protein